MYLLDTNILQAYLEGNQTVGDTLEEQILDGKEVKIDGIVYYEKKRGLLHKNMVERLTGLNNFVDRTRGIETSYTPEIFDRAASISVSLREQGRPTGKGIESDILIGALAIEKGYTVVTQNESHFRPMPDLEVENWLGSSKG